MTWGKVRGRGSETKGKVRSLPSLLLLTVRRRRGGREKRRNVEV